VAKVEKKKAMHYQKLVKSYHFLSKKNREKYKENSTKKSSTH